VSSEPESTVKPFVESMGDKMNYTVAAGDLHEYSRLFNVQGIPHAFLIDHNLNVRWNGHPLTPDMENKIDVLLNELKQYKAKKNEIPMQTIAMKQLTPEHLSNYSISDLINIMKANHLDPSQYLEKSEMIKALIESNKLQSTKVKQGTNTTHTSSATSQPTTNERKESASMSFTGQPKTKGVPMQCSEDHCAIPPHEGPVSEVSSSGVDLATVTEADLNQLPISTLKKLMKENNVDIGLGAFEKADLIKEILRKQDQSQPGPNCDVNL
jgi:hypothetical protein